MAIFNIRYPVDIWQIKSGIMQVKSSIRRADGRLKLYTPTSQYVSTVSWIQWRKIKGRQNPRFCQHV
jgi:hypothetical protein